MALGECTQLSSSARKKKSWDARVRDLQVVFSVPTLDFVMKDKESSDTLSCSFTASFASSRLV